MPVKRYALYLWMMLCLSACNLAQTEPTPVPAMLITNAPHLVAAWAEGGNLYVWQTGEAFGRRVASGGVIQPFIAPDGRHIAFTRGPAGAPDSLWLVSTDGTLEQQLVGEGTPTSYRESQMGQVVWSDATTLYFNTLKRAVPASSPKHDLYRASIITRTISLLLGPGEGGRISLSPKRDKIVLVSAGDYGIHNGRIRVIDALSPETHADLLYFTGAATGSHSGFYPPIAWVEDESALLAAIPDQDLLYSEDKGATVPPTTLWHLPIAAPGERKSIGTLPVSFFGMPRWSDDGTQMLYLTRTAGDVFHLMRADATGANPVEVDSGTVGEIEMPTWIPDTTQFFYTKGTAGHVLMAGRDNAPQPLSETVMLSPRFVTADRIVSFAPRTADETGYELKTWFLGQPAQTISPLSGPVVFDAVWVVPS